MKTINASTAQDKSNQFDDKQTDPSITRSNPPSAHKETDNQIINEVKTTEVPNKASVTTDNTGVDDKKVSPSVSQGKKSLVNKSQTSSSGDGTPNNK